MVLRLHRTGVADAEQQ